MKTKDEIRDHRLRQKYGITLEEYNQRLAKQGGVCAICGKPPKNKALHCEHDHKVNQVKVQFTKNLIFPLWTARAEYNSVAFMAVGKSKSDTSKLIREMLKRASVRGLTCWPCNRALQAFRDNPQLMRAAADYLDRFLHPAAVQPPPTTEKTHEA